MRQVLRSVLQLAAAFLFLASIAAPGLAGAKQDWRDCTSHSLEAVIQGCTRIITGRREDRHNLAIAYNNRGIAYGSKGQFDRAIADFDEAIKLDQKLAQAYGARGDAYEHNRGHLPSA